MIGPVGCRQGGHHWQCGGNCCDPDLSTQPALECIEVLPHRSAVGDNAARPLQRPFAFRCEALESRASDNKKSVECLFQLLETARQSWLGDAAHLRCAAKMAFAGKGNQKFQLVDQRLLQTSTYSYISCRQRL